MIDAVTRGGVVSALYKGWPALTQKKLCQHVHDGGGAELPDLTTFLAFAS